MWPESGERNTAQTRGLGNSLHEGLGILTVMSSGDLRLRGG